MSKSTNLGCVYTDGCRVEYLVGTYKELKEISKNAFGAYIAEQDDKLIPILDANQENVTDLRNKTRTQILETICPHCPLRRFV